VCPFLRHNHDSPGVAYFQANLQQKHSEHMMDHDGNVMKCHHPSPNLQFRNLAAQATEARGPPVRPPAGGRTPGQLGIISAVAGWWLTYPSEKHEFVSWDEIPNIWKVIKFMFQTTNQ